MAASRYRAASVGAQIPNAYVSPALMTLLIVHLNELDNQDSQDRSETAWNANGHVRHISWERTWLDAVRVVVEVDSL